MELDLPVDWSYVSRTELEDDEAGGSVSSIDGVSDLPGSEDGDDDLGMYYDSFNFQEDADDVANENESLFSANEEIETSANPVSDPWYPYGSKEMFIGCLITVMTKGKLSRSLRQFIFASMREFHIDMPSMWAINQKLSQVADELGRLLKMHRLEDGRLFYRLDIIQLIQREMANPLVAPHLRCFPDDALVKHSEITDDTNFTGTFWVNDTIIADDLKFYRIVRFAHRGGDILFAYLHRVYLAATDNDDLPPIFDMRETVCRPVNSLLKHLHVDTTRGVKIRTLTGNQFVGADHPSLHGERQRNADGKPIKIVPLLLQADDQSGNTSKRYNPHESYFFQLPSLPFYLQQLDFNVHLICTSNTMSSLEMAPALVDELKILEQGVVCYDASTGEEVIVRSPVLNFLGDNPMHSIIAGHIGMNGSHPCRFCDAPSGVSMAEVPLTTTVHPEHRHRQERTHIGNVSLWKMEFQLAKPHLVGIKSKVFNSTQYRLQHRRVVKIQTFIFNMEDNIYRDIPPLPHFRFVTYIHFADEAHPHLLHMIEMAGKKFISEWPERYVPELYCNYFSGETEYFELLIQRYISKIYRYEGLFNLSAAGPMHGTCMS
ncbi:hypothetical protein HDU85_005809 [Gaertneriomyces sp. JEL0708]|nr:hypothetical protein HDU85_005809 [Gaertneriomyces sp. JEL0708]